MVSSMSETLKDTPRRVRPRATPVRQNGPAIAAIRELSGWSQNRFAKFAGFSQPFLSGVESEQENTSAATLSLIASKLGVPVVAISSRAAVPCAVCAAREAAEAA
jgi:transcriptional regulator with XRE-family HTH domain